MNEPCRCLNCGGTNMESGALHSTGRMSFRPADAKFLKLHTANVEVDADLCLDCGCVALRADTRKVKALTDRQ
jgi:hypothetical protein